MAVFRKAIAHGHEANELEAFMSTLKHRELEDIRQFYHMTDAQNLTKIFQDGEMLPRKTDEPHWTPLARDQNSPIGVWFSASLYHSEDPESSEYGENRLKVPCSFIVRTLLKPRLFLETFYYFPSSPRHQIVRLVLVDAEQYVKEAEWCTAHCLRRLNMRDNDILVLDRDRRSYRCIKNDGVMYPYIWVEVLVVGSVDMVAIDTIDESRSCKQDAVPGTVHPVPK